MLRMPPSLRSGSTSETPHCGVSSAQDDTLRVMRCKHKNCRASKMSVRRLLIC